MEFQELDGMKEAPQPAWKTRQSRLHWICVDDVSSLVWSPSVCRAGSVCGLTTYIGRVPGQWNTGASADSDGHHIMPICFGYSSKLALLAARWSFNVVARGSLGKCNAMQAFRTGPGGCDTSRYSRGTELTVLLQL